MRSGWPHTQEDSGSLASQRQAQYGPMDSWPNGYPALGNGDGEHPYPTHGADPYAVEQPAPAAPPASPGGEHPYAAFGGPGQGAGIYTAPNIEAFGYGDPGYIDPGYDGPSSQDAGVAGTQTVRGTVESRGGYSGGGPDADQQVDIYHQPWDYNQPLRYDDEDPTWSLLESRDTDTRQQPAAFDPPGYNGSPLSSPGVAVPGYDLSGIIHTGEFPNIDYDQPSYGRLSYDDPRYADFRADDLPQGFDLPMLEEPPSNDTRYDLPALESPPHGHTRFDLPALDSRLDHAWPAREDLPSGPQSLDPGSFDPSSVSSLSSFESQSLEPSSFEPPSGINQTSMDLAADLPKLNQTRYDLPAVDDFQYGDRFTQTSADGMPALPDT
ncbi:MAG: hypothetical protein J2P26_10260, partial [Nocardiopsaceae bacterium]|nr:hypothetical protein [Nocardiopsaceae bacterium]